jgi:apolipoprotein N-acyltransferase
MKKAVFSGFLLALAFPSFLRADFNPWAGWLAWFALAPFLWGVREEQPAGAFRRGYVFGLVYFVVSLYWLQNVKPMGWWGARIGWLALSSYLALFPAAFAWITSRGLGKGWRLGLLWVPAAWTLLEFLRSWLFSGFPWAGLGDSQYQNFQVLPVAAVAGVYGLHFLVCFANVFWASFFGGLLPGGKAFWLQTLAVVLAFGWMSWQGRFHETPAAPRARVAVIQGNVDQDVEWTEAYKAGLMRTYLGLMDKSKALGAQAMVWPEGTFPGIFSPAVPEGRSLVDFARKNQVDLLVGADVYDQGRGTFGNAAVWVGANGGYGSYLKQHLVPFGEYVPFRSLLPFVDKAVKRFGVVDFAPGSGPVVFPTRAGQAAPLICYEGIFPELCAVPAAKANWLTVMTFDTWYGDSAAPYQHVGLAVLRAVEQGRWLARAGATGISCFISPQGEILDAVPLNQAGFAVREIPLLTQPTLYQRWGNWLLWACAGLFAFCLALPAKKP